MEKKAELYEHLSDKTGSSQLAEKFLVDFQGKKDKEPVIPSPKRDESQKVIYNDTDSENEWYVNMSKVNSYDLHMVNWLQT